MEFLPGLDTFILLANSGSLSAAARALGVPRSTISRRLVRLEESVGVPLVDRNSRNLKLTEAGRVLLERGGPLVAGLRDLHTDVQQLDGVPSGRLRIASPPGLGSDLSVEFVETLCRRWPLLRPEFHIRAYRPHLLEEDFDVVFCEGPVDDAPWIRTRLGPADRFVVASPAYMQEHGVPQSLEELAEHRCISLTGPVDRPDEWPRIDGGTVAVDPVIVSNDPQGACALVLAGQGLALLPYHACVGPLSTGALVKILPEVGRASSLYALTTRRQGESPKLRALLSLIDEFAARDDYGPHRRLSDPR
ncbi:MAG: LysR family transcriptional regulator [Myxococcota bacterium]